MPRTRRSKSNGTTFEDIPKLPDVPDNIKIINLLKKKYDLKHKREKYVRDAREIRETIYNLSMQINELETKADELMLLIVNENNQSEDQNEMD